MASYKMTTALFVVIGLITVELANSHSFTTDPQGVTSETCRVGGDPKYGPVTNCRGPCDLSTLDKPGGAWANFYPPDKPARVWERGQAVTVKYARNNHGPGGFVRLAIVPLKDAMDKKVHEANAFHTSCWGAHPMIATGDELKPRDKWGFDMIGTDGREHSFEKGYYKVGVTVPDVIPDGDYYFGFLWYGGTGTKLTGNAPQEPRAYSYFGEYWTCSFIKIKGGAPLASSYTPKFVNDMSQFSTEGCMSAADRPGVAVSEPNLDMKTFFRKPARFANGDPPPMTPENFGGSAPPGAPAPPSSPAPPASPNPAPSKPAPVPEEPSAPAPKPDYPKDPAPPSTPDYGDSPGKVCFGKDLMSCVCISGSRYGCTKVLAAYTNGCMAGYSYRMQRGECVSSCCALCKETGTKFAACRHERVKSVCANA